MNIKLFEGYAMIRIVTVQLAIVAVLSLHGSARANEPSLKKYAPPAESKKDEPIAKQFSMDKAVDFLDNAALQWTDKRGCFSCHTNLAYLYARPMVSAQGQAHADVRNSLEGLVTKRWPDKKPRWDAEVVAAAAALAYNDSLTTKKLQPVTRTALDRMWTVQQKDGGIRWLKLDQPPMEFDDHYGVTLAALAVGVAPEDYAKTDQAKKGIDNLRRWLQANPAKNLHHKTMLLWVSTYLDGFQSADEQKATVKELYAKQLPDGGWSTSSLGDWTRADGNKQTPDVADGYGTGFTIFVLRRAGVPAADPALIKGIAWLKANQRTSGRWFTRSLVNDNNKHYLAHIGSAFAVMAIQACEDEGFANWKLMRMSAEEAEKTDKVKEMRKELATIQTMLEKADSMELLQLNPRFIGKDAKNTFYGYEIIKRVPVESAEKRKEVAVFLGKSLHWNWGLRAACFDPRHGLVLMHGKKVTELVICFHCSQIRWYENGVIERNLVVSAEQYPLLTKILRDGGK